MIFPIPALHRVHGLVVATKWDLSHANETLEMPAGEFPRSASLHLGREGARDQRLKGRWRENDCHKAIDSPITGTIRNRLARMAGFMGRLVVASIASTFLSPATVASLPAGESAAGLRYLLSQKRSEMRTISVCRF